MTNTALSNTFFFNDELKESIFNHWGKMAFRWIYWNMLLKGIAIPMVSRNMSLKGKKIN